MTAQLSLDVGQIRGTAILSPCERYRYRLSREWGDVENRVAFCMLNPSTADANINDPTIRRCIAFARVWGFGALDVVNLFAWRSTDPKALPLVHNPIGIENDDHVIQACMGAGRVVAAWGNHGALLARDKHVLAMLWVARIKPLCFGLTKSGMPSHPLYQRANARLIEVHS